MQSPFRSEAAAFRFLLISIGAFALIVGASWINPWLGFLVFLLLSAGAVWIYLRQRGPSPPPERIERIGAEDERRVLVVANETVGGEELMSAIGTTTHTVVLVALVQAAVVGAGYGWLALVLTGAIAVAFGLVRQLTGSWQAALMTHVGLCLGLLVPYFLVGW